MVEDGVLLLLLLLIGVMMMIEMTVKDSALCVRSIGCIKPNECRVVDCKLWFVYVARV